MIILSVGQLLRIHAFSIAVTAEEVYDQINAGIAELGLFNDTGSLVRGEDLVSVNSDYVGAGFSQSTSAEELGKSIYKQMCRLCTMVICKFIVVISLLIFSPELIPKVASTTGIFLDGAFTIKPVRGMLSEMVKNPNQFKGRRVLFIHTGM